MVVLELHGSTRARRAAAVLAALLVSALLLAGAPAPARAQAAAPPPCPEAVPTSELREGMRATGYTVSRGTAIETFDVEILGVLTDGIAPGRDMIIVDTDSPAIRRAGGIWFGMSGSPVYVGDRLVGAVAFGLGFGKSTIGGLTAAQDMRDLLTLPPGTQERALTSAEPRADGAMARRVAERDGRSYAGERESFRRLALPMAVSGLSAARLATFGDVAQRSGQSVVPYASSAAPLAAQPVTAERPVPGGNFAGALSYGDLTAAGVGTTTFVCEDRAVAFGHPFLFSGGTTMGASLASAITIVDDAVFPGFKLANLTGLLGTVDQDRLAGIRATLGARPASVPVTSEVRDLDLGRARAGRTDVVLRDALPILSVFHLVSNIDVVADRVGEGSAEVTYRISGAGADSGPFELTRTNRFASDFDVAFESAFELLDSLFRLDGTAVDRVTIESVDVDVDIERAVRRYTLREVRVGVDGEPPVRTRRVEALPGSVLDLEIDLRASDGTPARTVALTLEVPDDAGEFGFLSVGAAVGQGGFDDCFFDPAACEEDGPATLAELVADIQDAPRNDELVATLTTDTFDGGDCTVTTAPDGTETVDCPPPSQDPGAQPAPEPVEVRELLDKVVSGQRGIEVDLSGGGCPDCPIGEPEPAGVVRVAGTNRIDTAIAASQVAYPQADTVVLARADRYPDALAGGPLAAQVGGPVLLTPSDRLPRSVADEIQRLGASSAILLGGQAALGTGVAGSLAELGISDVQRVGGPDRFATAAAIAARVLGSQDGGGGTVFVAEGANADPARGWPDALSASAGAAHEGAAVLLVTHQAAPAVTLAAIRDLGVRKAVIVGGPAAVSDAVGGELVAAGASVERLSGPTRYDTSIAVAERAVAQGADPSVTWLATGRAFPDALVGGPAAAATGGVLLLVDGRDLSGSPSTREWLEGLAGGDALAFLLGGQSAISAATEQQIGAALGLAPTDPAPSPGPDPQPERPRG
jgi:putative cell wall-binding protein